MPVDVPKVNVFTLEVVFCRGRSGGDGHLVVGHTDLGQCGKNDSLVVLSLKVIMRVLSSAFVSRQQNRARMVSNNNFLISSYLSLK